MLKVSTSLETQYLLELLDSVTVAQIEKRSSFDFDKGTLTVIAENAIHALRLQSATLPQIRQAFGMNKYHQIMSIQYLWKDGSGKHRGWRHPIPRLV